MQITNINQWLEAAKSDSLLCNNESSIYNYNSDFARHMTSPIFMGHLETILEEISRGSYSRSYKRGYYLVEGKVSHAKKILFFSGGNTNLWKCAMIFEPVEIKNYTMIKKLNIEEL